MKLQHLRRVRTSYPGGGIWYAQFYPRASGYSGRIEAGCKQKVSMRAGGQDILTSKRMPRFRVLVGTVGALGFAFVATAYLLL